MHFHDLDAAASYLGMSEEELRTALGEGQTLAEIAEARDKPVDGLIDTLVAAAAEDLDEAVADGRLTEEQKAEILSNLEERITARVNGERGPGPGRRFWPAAYAGAGIRGSGLDPELDITRVICERPRQRGLSA